jgi:hypothetical protein
VKSISMISRARLYEAIALALFAGMVVLFVHKIVPLIADQRPICSHAFTIVNGATRADHPSFPAKGNRRWIRMALLFLRSV